MKNFLIVSTLLLIMTNLVCCNKISDEEKLNQSNWEKVSGKEFSNWEVWAGTGFYFYEEDSKKYCIFMMYGSGVPVAYHYTSLVIMNEGIITISLPTNMGSANINEGIDDDEVADAELVIVEDAVMLGDARYTLSEGLNSFDTLKEN